MGGRRTGGNCGPLAVGDSSGEDPGCATLGLWGQRRLSQGSAGRQPLFLVGQKMMRWWQLAGAFSALSAPTAPYSVQLGPLTHNPPRLLRGIKSTSTSNHQWLFAFH